MLRIIVDLLRGGFEDCFGLTIAAESFRFSFVLPYVSES